MEKVNVHQAKTHFSRLLERAEQGEEFVIARAGKPVARLGPLHKSPTKRRLGALKGKIKVPEDFDAPLPESVLRAFEGRGR
ncbi:MAG TPA: type II toxin-antitoxin system Phd/YefM family antitoxin [Burkholderiales bacterium]|nr:type II toxin-antitoxin system Phd/YefM family antitoxin [Burkholderiales bacterium]